jgi:xanthine dehydrogenase accessory factor
MTTLPAFLAMHSSAVLVDLIETKGSTPREAGTFMLVSKTAIWGTIGGGQFEYMAIDNARALLAGAGTRAMDIPLGPEIGQCCGGRTLLTFTPVAADDAAMLTARLKREEEDWPAVALFGAGHVGLALVAALQPLPLAVTVFETRAEALADLPQASADKQTARRLTAMPEAEVAGIPKGGAAIILTHDHALDFLIAEQALMRPDLSYVGMIGSLTKRATFASWLKRQRTENGMEDAADMLARLTLPVGGAVVKDKRPAVIAAMVAAELLTVYAARLTDRARTAAPA